MHQPLPASDVTVSMRQTDIVISIIYIQLFIIVLLYRDYFWISMLWNYYEIIVSMGHVSYPMTPTPICDIRGSDTFCNSIFIFIRKYIKMFIVWYLHESVPGSLQILKKSWKVSNSLLRGPKKIGTGEENFFFSPLNFSSIVMSFISLQLHTESTSLVDMKMYQASSERHELSTCS